MTVLRTSEGLMINRCAHAICNCVPYRLFPDLCLGMRHTGLTLPISDTDRFTYGRVSK